MISAETRAGASQPATRLPDFFIVGQPKSGTTALYEMLGAHPQIFLPASKEPWFFASELHVRTPPRPEGTPRTLEEYATLFAAARDDQRVGEASPQYLWSRTAAAAIAAVQPGAQIIAIFREPVSFLRSLHAQCVQTYVETESDFARALSLEPARREGRHIPRHTYWPDRLLYSEHVKYVDQLRRFDALFPADQMLILIYDDFSTDNEGTVRRVLRFLKVDDTVPVTVREANPTVHVRSKHLNTLVHTLSVGRGPISMAVKGTVKAVVPRRLRRGALAAAKQRIVYGGEPAVDESLIADLRRRLLPEVEAFGRYIDRDLIKLWGYDGLA